MGRPESDPEAIVLAHALAKPRLLDDGHEPAPTP